jgi:hypothetical protein
MGDPSKASTHLTGCAYVLAGPPYIPSMDASDAISTT